MKQGIIKKNQKLPKSAKIIDFSKYWRIYLSTKVSEMKFSGEERNWNMLTPKAYKFR